MRYGDQAGTAAVLGRPVIALRDVDPDRAGSRGTCPLIAAYWRRRADVLEASAPRPGDYRGRATDDELEERSRRVRGLAAACRAHADAILAGGPEPISPEVRFAFGEAEGRFGATLVEPPEHHPDPGLTWQE